MHLMQNWFGLSDPATEEAPYEITPMRAFAGLTLMNAIPDETTILNFRHRLEANELAPEILSANTRRGRSRPSAAGSRRWGGTRAAYAEEHRECQGELAGKSRASVPGHQAPVGPGQSTLSWAGEKHRACARVVRVVESVDGTTAIAGDDGIVASAAAERRNPEANDCSERVN